jgi:putative phosphoribosyl transferase
MNRTGKLAKERIVQIKIDQLTLEGSLLIPEVARGLVLFAHGSGSSRFSPRNTYVAKELWKVNLATLLFDLLTKEEERIDSVTAQLRFNIRLLADRLIGATDWLNQITDVKKLSIGYFGASTGAAAALAASAERADVVKAIVSRGGRPDLAGEALPRVKAPTLLIVGGNDRLVLDLNRGAMVKLNVGKKLAIVPGATHLFEEPGTLEEVARLAAAWFQKYLGSK